tara:strand:- start:563 stop:757 length:195 start_codon:yes stop_codon:yes gene_type:complete
MFSYAYYILVKEAYQIEQALNEWDENNYPEARKQRDKRLKDLMDAIYTLQEHEKLQCAFRGEVT